MQVRRERYIRQQGALFFLPLRTQVETSSLRGLRDMVVAVAVGTLVAVLAFAVLTRPYETIAGFFLANSVPGGAEGSAGARDSAAMIVIIGTIARS